MSTKILSSKVCKKRVSFSAENIIIGTADEEYDRTTIKVDLRNTPYALFHKDDYFKNHPEEYSVTKDKKTEKTAEEGSATEPCSSDDESCARSDCADFVEKPMHSHKSRPNFSGVWRRSHNEGFIDLLRFTGVPFNKAKVAANKASTHIIDHDDEYFRLIILNGLKKLDNYFFIGDEPKKDNFGNSKYYVSLEWSHGDPHENDQSLVLTSKSIEMGTNAHEMIAIRSLHGNGNILVLQQIIRRLLTGEEVRATHIFKRITKMSEVQRLCCPPSPEEALQEGNACEEAAAAIADRNRLVMSCQK